MKIFRRIRPAAALIVLAVLVLSVKVGEIRSGLSGGPGIAVAQASERVASGAAEAEPEEIAQAARPDEQTKPLDSKQSRNPERPGGSASDLARELEHKRDQPQETSPLALREGGGRDPRGFTAAEIELLQDLSARREELARRENELVLQEAMIQAAEQRIQLKIDELKNLQVSIQGLLQQHGEEEEQQLRRLVKIYESMKPDEAARIFEQLDMDVLLDVVERMREARVAPVLAEMDPLRAKTVTMHLAERRQLPERGG
ncbi:MAG: hypothetical protein WD270_03280 [Acetobacterales bacterium]